MTVAGFYYLVTSLVVIVLGAAVIARIARVDPRASRLIMLIVGIVVAVQLLVLFVWIVLMKLGMSE